MSINCHCGRNIVQITEKWCFQRGKKEGVLFSITETEPSEPSRGMKGKRTHNNQVLRVRREAMNKKISDFCFLLFIHLLPLQGD